VAVPSLWASVEFLDKATDDIQFARHVYVNGRVDTVAKKAETLGEQNQNILRDLQIDTANGKRTATINDIKKWQLELDKPGVDQTLKGFIQQQIDALSATKDKLDAQLRTLTEIKSH
jgi:prefoldin subunit 5